MQVRTATESDQTCLLDLRRCLWPECPDALHRGEIRAMLENPARFAVMLAEDEAGKAIGYLEASSREDIVEGCEIQRIGYVEGWYVIPTQRRKGVGRALMRAAEKWMLAQGLTVLGSDTDLERKDSQKAHEALGFPEVDRLIAYRKRVAR